MKTRSGTSFYTVSDGGGGALTHEPPCVPCVHPGVQSRSDIVITVAWGCAGSIRIRLHKGARNAFGQA
jgi:hypothetical protein